MGTLNFFSRMFHFTEVEIPLSFDGRQLKVLSPDKDAPVIEAFFVSSHELTLALMQELYLTCNTLKTTKGKSPEEEALRITLINKLQHKYSTLFSIFKEPGDTNEA